MNETVGMIQMNFVRATKGGYYDRSYSFVKNSRTMVLEKIVLDWLADYLTSGKQNEDIYVMLHRLNSMWRTTTIDTRFILNYGISKCLRIFI